MLLEEALEGREVSVFAHLRRPRDGTDRVRRATTNAPATATPDRTPAAWARTRRRIGFPHDLDDRVRERILAPVLRGLLAEGEQYVGVLYCGLMWTADGPYVIEFNVRFGDPETQVLMPRVRGDFAAVAAFGRRRVARPERGFIRDSQRAWALCWQRRIIRGAVRR